MSPLFDDMQLAANWNGVIAPFCIKVYHTQEFPAFNPTTDIQLVSNYLINLTRFFESAPIADLYIFEFPLNFWNRYSLSNDMAIGWKQFCNSVEIGDSFPTPYIHECLRNYERPEYEKVKTAIEADKMMKSLEELPE